MKNKRFQIFAILLAFCIGVTINYSCGDSFKADAVSTTYMWNEIKAMQNEIQKLQDEISSLKNGGSSSSGDFQVAGLWFNRSGGIVDKIKEHTFQYYSNGSVWQSSTYKYEYDNYGRQNKTTSVITTPDHTTTYTGTTLFNGKTATITTYTDGIMTSKQTTTYF